MISHRKACPNRMWFTEATIFIVNNADAIIEKLTSFSALTFVAMEKIIGGENNRMVVEMLRLLW